MGFREPSVLSGEMKQGGKRMCVCHEAREGL